MRFKSYEDIPENDKKLICEAHDLKDVTDMSLKDIDEFYKEIHYQDVVTSIRSYYKYDEGD